MFTLNEAYAEACQALGELIVKDRLITKAQEKAQAESETIPDREEESPASE